MKSTPTPTPSPAGGAGVSWWRLWTVQGSFEPAGQQWAGWMVCMAPWLRSSLDAQARNRWLETEPTTLNTNPYLIGLLVGVRQRVEAEQGPELARRVTSGLQSALGALGDALLWSAWRPAFALLAAVVGQFGGSLALAGVWLLFAATQAWLRQAALRWGQARGLRAIEELARLDAQAWTRRGRILGATLAGALGVSVLYEVTSAVPGGSPALTAPAVLSALVGTFVAWRRLRGEVALMGTGVVVWILARVSVGVG